MQQKQLNMVSFLWEIFYDLALAPGDNVSRSPGFERYLSDFWSRCGEDEMEIDDQ